MNPSVEHVLRFFRCEHMGVSAQLVAQPFQDLAKQICSRAPNSPETTIALRKLLESRDAALRAIE